jgi:hypothetical protein
MGIIPDAHHESPLRVKHLDFFVQGQTSEIFLTHFTNFDNSISEAI